VFEIHSKKLCSVVVIADVVVVVVVVIATVEEIDAFY
jgi:hypothetical protein